MKSAHAAGMGGGMSVSAARLRNVALDFTPVEVAARCRHLRDLVFFDTALETGAAGEISIVAANPHVVVRGKSEAEWRKLRAALAARRIPIGFDDGLPRGFAAGFVEYDGAFRFGFYDDALIFRHADQTWSELGDLCAHLAESPAPVRAAPTVFDHPLSRDAYCMMVARAQDYIAAGDIYQVNLAHRFAAPWEGDPFAFYEALRHYSPAPHAAYLECDGRAILSASPESFLKMSGRAIRTRPIKGTRPRRADLHADEKSAYDLLTSPKEIAELVMITDLERNDLGQVCEFGSVSVPELLKLERFEQVFHLVSTVEGQLREEVDHLSALRACFPGGSITGAPKKRAREIIAELEPERRGLYTGAIGWLGFSGESQLNIAIRTVVIENGVAHFHVGAGIVADSVPELEWQETLDKAAGILLAGERLSECGN
ncbi:MAG TPA: aminodeoxychorismate synthase component I [Chthoniobacteraceae bacterium]|nr:aminodeoxychorismate synthase component I [Chthoniobacteraceae bacterium]